MGVAESLALHDFFQLLRKSPTMQQLITFPMLSQPTSLSTSSHNFLLVPIPLQHTLSISCKQIFLLVVTVSIMAHLLCDRGAPWSAANRLIGQRIVPDLSSGIPCFGFSRMTDQFRLYPTQSCAPVRRCDWVSSVSSHRTREVLRHLPTCEQPSGFVLHAYQPPPWP